MNHPAIDTITRYRVIPIIAIDNAASALPLADVLLSGGLPLIEITFRTEAAMHAIASIRAERPDMVVGAGSVLTPDQVDAAADAGASFAVAPGCSEAVVRRAQERGLPFMPGVATASDIERALALGCTLQKYFPAGALGGTAMIKALSGPYAPNGVRFIPTGGVNQDNLAEYLALPAVTAVGGTWLAPKADIAAHAWDVIEARAAAAAATVAAS